MIAAATLGYYFAKYLAETVFFDKFVLNKSTDFGYWPHDANADFESFGERAKDIADLDQFISYGIAPNLSRVLGANTEKKQNFTIIIIGDSYVWGQGIRIKDRFAGLLEQRLNKIAPTRVISLARPGDGLFDNYVKYELAKRAYPETDLFIIGVVDNDVVLLGGINSYNEQQLQSFIQSCGARPMLYFEPDISEEEYYKENYSNKCVFQKTLTLLPKNNVLYFDYGSKYFSQFEFSEQLILHEMEKEQLPILSATLEIERVARGDYERVRVSRFDSHPNAVANRIFSDALFRHIISTQQYYADQQQAR